MPSALSCPASGNLALASPVRLSRQLRLSGLLRLVQWGATVAPSTQWLVIPGALASPGGQAVGRGKHQARLQAPARTDREWLVPLGGLLRLFEALAGEPLARSARLPVALAEVAGTVSILPSLEVGTPLFRDRSPGENPHVVSAMARLLALDSSRSFR